MLPELLEHGRAALHGPYLVPALLGTALLYIVGSYVVAYRRLSHFDGPWLASFSSLWMAWQVPKMRQGDIYRDVMRKYGRGGSSSLVRIGPNDLLTDSYELLRRMGSARSTYKRSSWYHAAKLDPYGDSVLSIMDTAAHDKMKARLMFGYSGKEVPGLEDLVDEQLARLVCLIRGKYLSDDDTEAAGATVRPMDLGATIFYFTLDTIGRLAYGEPFGFLAEDRDVNGYLEIFQGSLLYIVSSCEILSRKNQHSFGQAVRYDKSQTVKPE